VWLSAASGPGPASGPWQQETPEKRGQKQEWQGSDRSGDVHLAARRRRQLHGPINKKIWATFAGRKAAALWARAEATKRGFGPDTTKTVQIVLDGVESLENDLEALFPKAIFTVDVWHVVERLWSLGRHFHQEGSDALATWVDDFKAFLYADQAKELVEVFRGLFAASADAWSRHEGASQRLDGDDWLYGQATADDAYMGLGGNRTW